MQQQINNLFFTIFSLLIIFSLHAQEYIVPPRVEKFIKAEIEHCGIKNCEVEVDASQEGDYWGAYQDELGRNKTIFIGKALVTGLNKQLKKKTKNRWQLYIDRCTMSIRHECGHLYNGDSTMKDYVLTGALFLASFGLTAYITNFQPETFEDNIKIIGSFFLSSVSAYIIDTLLSASYSRYTESRADDFAVKNSSRSQELFAATHDFSYFLREEEYHRQSWLNKCKDFFLETHPYDSERRSKFINAAIKVRDTTYN